MIDQLSERERSAFMARIRSHDTRPEMIVRQQLHRIGYRYHLHHKSLPGRPDLAFMSRRKAVFVHGCFWHAHKGCAFAHVPKTRSDYWRAKFEGNRARDERNITKLNAADWEVLVIWECEVAEQNSLLTRLVTFLGPAKWCPEQEPGAPAQNNSK